MNPLHNDAYLSPPHHIIANLRNQRRLQIQAGVPLDQLEGVLSHEDLILVKKWWAECTSDAQLFGMKLIVDPRQMPTVVDPQ